MVRIFRHYLSARLILIIGLETLVFVLALQLGLAFSLPGAQHRVDAPWYLTTGAFVVSMLVLMNIVGLYNRDHWADQQSVRVRLLAAVVLVGSIFLLVPHVAPYPDMEPRGIAIMDAAVVLGVALVRFVFYKWDRLATLKPRVLVLGTGSRVSEFAELAQRNRNCEIVGYLPVASATEHFVPAGMVLPLAPDESLVQLVKRHRIDHIVLAVRDRRGKLPLQDLLDCKMQGVRITELSTAFEREYRQVALETITPSWVMLEDGFHQGIVRTAVKRLFDLFVAATLLFLTLPVLIAAAVCIAVESGFPILYRQERVGQGGRAFSMYKLRSMRQDAERDGTPRWASAHDDRTTRVGRVLRKLRIDELPQLINVFKGDMSFVGPRPERPYFVDKLVKQLPYYSLRHTIKPGITGWAQVCYPYGASLEETTEKLKYDLYYVKNHALFLDLVILFATVEVVLTGKGAR